MNRAQVIQQVVLGLFLGVLVFFGVEWLLKVELSHSNMRKEFAIRFSSCPLFVYSGFSVVTEISTQTS